MLGLLAALLVAVAVAAGIALAGGTGSEEVVVPAVRGQDLATANNVLQGLGLRTIIAAPIADAEVPEGGVVGTVPPAGTSLRTGEFVTLTASTGPEPIAVPAVVGLPESAARAALQEAGLTPGARVAEPNDDVPAGEVLRAEPAPGTLVDAAGTVTLVVSSGPEPVVLPRVIGLTADEARRQLEQLGLTVETTAVAGDAGRVVDQVPDPGVSVQRGDSVVLVVGGA
jgi:serine/threonine-protein kinase